MLGHGGADPGVIAETGQKFYGSGRIRKVIQRDKAVEGVVVVAAGRGKGMDASGAASGFPGCCCR